MSGDHVDPRVHPQAIRTIEPGAVPLSPGEPFGPLLANQFGAVWVSLGDPADGLAVDINVLDTDVPATGINNARSLMVGAIQLVDDGAQFALVSRGALDADDLAATRVAQLTSSALSGWNPAGAGWDRVRVLGRGVDITSPNFDLGILATAAGLYLSNAAGTIQSQMLSADTAVDDIAASATNWMRTAGVLYAFDGAAFDRLGTASATNLAAQSTARALLAQSPGEWTLTSAPAANTTATATRAAAGGVAHVLKSINATLTAVAAIAAPIGVVVRDGLTGVGAILWQDRLFAAAAGTESRVSLSGLNIIGTAGNAMTVEFLAAPGATNFETISATGVST